MDKITEKKASKISGFIALFIVIGLFALDIYLLATGIRTEDPSFLWFFIPLVFISFVSFGGFMIVQPNESKVLMLFGKYTGTWRFAYNETQIVITTESLPIPLTNKIVELTTSSLKITTSYSILGVSTNIRMTFKAK